MLRRVLSKRAEIIPEEHVVEEVKQLRTSIAILAEAGDPRFAGEGWEPPVFAHRKDIQQFWNEATAFASHFHTEVCRDSCGETEIQWSDREPLWSCFQLLRRMNHCMTAYSLKYRRADHGPYEGMPEDMRFPAEIAKDVRHVMDLHELCVAMAEQLERLRSSGSILTIPPQQPIQLDSIASINCYILHCAQIAGIAEAVHNQECDCGTDTNIDVHDRRNCDVILALGRRTMQCMEEAIRRHIDERYLIQVRAYFAAANMFESMWLTCTNRLAREDEVLDEHNKTMEDISRQVWERLVRAGFSMQILRGEFSFPEENYREECLKMGKRICAEVPIRY